MDWIVSVTSTMWVAILQGEEWRSALMEHGVQCVLTIGTTAMPL